MDGRSGKRGGAESVIDVGEEIRGIVSKKQVVGMAGCRRNLEGVGELANARSVGEVGNMA